MVKDLLIYGTIVVSAAMCGFLLATAIWLGQTTPTEGATLETVHGQCWTGGCGRTEV